MRLLVISHAFPPSRHSNAKRPYYLAKGFWDAGWDVDVFTGPLGMAPGEPELAEPAGLRVFRLKDSIAGLLQKSVRRDLFYHAFSAAACGLM